MRIIVSIWKKNMKKYFRNRMESVGSLIQPLMWLLLFSVGMSSFMTGPDGAFDYLTFVLPGMIGFTIVSASINGGTSWIDERMSGIVKTYQAAPISRFAPLVANVMTVLSKVLIQCLVILAVGLLLGASLNVNLISFLIAFLLVILFGIGFSGIALYFASKAPNGGAYHMVIFMFQMPMLFFSNALYTTAQLPLIFKVIATLNPMTYLISGLRRLTAPIPSHGVMDLIVQLAILSVFALFGMIIATNAYKGIIDQD